MTFSEIVAPLNLTPTQLSRKLGCSDGHVHDLLKGRRQVSIQMAAKLESLTRRKGLVAAVAAEKVRAQ